MEFFSTLQDILTTKNPDEKIANFQSFYKLYKKDKIVFNHKFKPITFTSPSFSSICTIKDATSMPKRSSLSTNKGKAYLVHSILHIEYSAIDLALDHAYRFQNMPKDFYDDWLRVADDEIRHFRILEDIIHSLGYRYGSFFVHSFLFDISQKTLDLLTRMAVVPRYLEASGLDSSPQVIKKLKNIDDPFAKEIIKALKIILEEEISHVSYGDKWFLWACKKEGVDKSKYFNIVEKILPGAKKKKSYVNITDRKKAGFSCEEISVISDKKCK